MSREAHVQFCESLGGDSPGLLTHLESVKVVRDDSMPSARRMFATMFQYEGSKLGRWGRYSGAPPHDQWDARGRSAHHRRTGGSGGCLGRISGESLDMLGVGFETAQAFVATRWFPLRLLTDKVTKTDEQETSSRYSGH